MSKCVLYVHGHAERLTMARRLIVTFGNAQEDADIAERIGNDEQRHEGTQKELEHGGILCSGQKMNQAPDA